jgi:hypothetical protein
MHSKGGHCSVKLKQSENKKFCRLFPELYTYKIVQFILLLNSS